MSSLPFEGTYPADDRFWVPPKEQALYPLRFGDLFSTQALNLSDSRGRSWVAVMATHPSCELGAKSAPTGVQVVRVHRLREVSARQRDEVRAGFVEVDGQVRPARVNTCYLAPVDGVDGLDEELYADLRATARVDLEALKEAGRIAAMTHDARLALLRRDIAFRYRWQLPPDQILALESARIGGDAKFEGPVRPGPADPRVARGASPTLNQSKPPGKSVGLSAWVASVTVLTGSVLARTWAVPDDRVRAPAGDQAALGQRLQHPRRVGALEPGHLSDLGGRYPDVPGLLYRLEHPALRRVKAM